MTDFDLEELKRLEVAATPAPWSVGGFTGTAVAADYSPVPRNKADSDFIAALRNAAPELIAAAEREETRGRREGTHAPEGDNPDALSAAYFLGCADVRSALVAAEKERDNLRAVIRFRATKEIVDVTRIAELEAALRPFAEESDKYDHDPDDDSQPSFDEGFTIGDFRRARAALASKPGADGEMGV